MGVPPRAILLARLHHASPDLAGRHPGKGCTTVNPPRLHDSTETSWAPHHVSKRPITADETNSHAAPAERATVYAAVSV